MFNFLFDGKLGELLAPIGGESNQLFLAIQHHKHDEAQSLILNSTLDLSKPSDAGYAAIHVACKYNNRHMVDFLNNRGIHIESLDVNGNSTLHYASQYDHLELCKFLIERGCSAGRKNARQQTPYDVAQRPTVRQYLLPLQFKCENEQQTSAGNNSQSSNNNNVYAAGGYVAPTQPAVQYMTSSAYLSATPSSHQQQPQTIPAISYPPAIASSPPSYPPVEYSSSSSSLSDISARPTHAPSAGAPAASSSGTRVIQADGFHTSASDPALQAKYGHNKQMKFVAPPPMTSSAPTQQYSMFGTTQATGPAVYNRYVAYDAVTNTAVLPPPMPAYNAAPSYPSNISANIPVQPFGALNNNGINFPQQTSATSSGIPVNNAIINNTSFGMSFQPANTTPILPHPSSNSSSATSMNAPTSQHLHVQPLVTPTRALVGGITIGQPGPPAVAAASPQVYVNVFNPNTDSIISADSNSSSVM